MSMTLNPLATPKGVKLLCTRCQKPAYIQCTKCGVTYYCSEAHQEEGWEAIHQKICPVVAVLRAPQPHVSSSEEREHRREQQLLRKKYIIDVALREGRRFLHEGLPNLAIPAALEAQKFLTEIHGSAHIELAPAYLILAEAAIGLGRLSEADQYLSQAQWAVLKAKECDASLKARLHRNLGLLAAAKGKTEEARRQFAEDIYQSSIAYSPSAIETSGGYYHLGCAFLRENKPEITNSLHHQVVAIWREFLEGLVKAVRDESASSQKAASHFLQSEEHTASPAYSLDSTQQAEAYQMLHSIRELSEQQVHSSTPREMAPIYHTLSLLHYVLRENEKCEAYARRALEFLNVSGSQPERDAMKMKESIETLLQSVIRPTQAD